MPALYRKYRSASFGEVIGQRQVTDVLEASLKKGRFAHGYLFVGPHGVGKTSVARILAFAINGLDYEVEKKHIDIIEIDAASNTGVDNIRELIEKAQIAPSLASKKVYIIDEVHMLSKSAFNALLKLLEEPPEHVVFILATTEEHKVPATIISRMQKFVFRKIPSILLVDQLKMIARQEKIKISDEALQNIAEFADGGMRDAISLFDQLSNLADNKKELDSNSVRRVLGLADQRILNSILNSFLEADFGKITSELETLKRQNIASTDIAQQLAKLAEKSLSEKPELINLLAKLLDVPRSNLPDLSLSLALFPDQLRASLPAPVVVSQSAKKVVLEEVKISKIKTSKQATTNSEAVAEKTPKESEPSTETKPSQTTENISPKSEAIASTPSDFDWENFLKTAQQTEKTLLSYLQNAKHQVNGNDLTIFLRNAFEKKKLDEPSRLASLGQILIKMNCNNLNIITAVDSKKQGSSQELADVIKVMGGGEEVKIDGQI